jgi:chitinase
LTFAPGETSKTITVLVDGDRREEADEFFFVILSSPSNATLADSQGVGTIQNDDGRGAPGALSVAGLRDVVFASWIEEDWWKPKVGR